MHVDYAVLCLGVYTLESGAPCLMGVIETYAVKEEPAAEIVLPPLFLAARLRADPGDPLDSMTVTVRLVDDDMQPVFALPDIPVNFRRGVPGVSRGSNLHLELRHVVLPGLGHYQVQLLAASHVLGVTPLYVRMA